MSFAQFASNLFWAAAALLLALPMLKSFAIIVDGELLLPLAQRSQGLKRKLKSFHTGRGRDLGALPVYAFCSCPRRLFQRLFPAPAGAGILQRFLPMIAW